METMGFAHIRWDDRTPRLSHTLGPCWFRRVIDKINKRAKKAKEDASV